MTGAAQNLLAVNIARSMGVVVPDVWATWAMGALLPGVVSIAMVPAMVASLAPPGDRAQRVRVCEREGERERERTGTCGPAALRCVGLMLLSLF
jgi:di/tricarboxylate transporter